MAVLIHAHWGKNPYFYPKIHISKIPIFTKFTFLKSQFSQNSHFQNLIFHKIQINETNFTQNSRFSKLNSRILGNFWIKKKEFMPQCDKGTNKKGLPAKHFGDRSMGKCPAFFHLLSTFWALGYTTSWHVLSGSWRPISAGYRCLSRCEIGHKMWRCRCFTHINVILLFHILVVLSGIGVILNPVQF